MDSVLSIPVVYLLLLFTQLITAADSPSGGNGKTSDASSTGQTSRLDVPRGNRLAEQQQAILRLLLLATQGNSKAHNLQFRPNNWGIPYRPVRRIGSEFLGKRSNSPIFEEDEEDEIEKRARMGSEFLGKRRMGSEFLGKRAMGSEFLGKRRMGSEFLGKRRMGSEFLGKRGMGSEFLGKRAMGSEFLGKRGMGSEFLGKRRMGSEFLGKRRMGSEFLGKRAMGSDPSGLQDYDYDMNQEDRLATSQSFENDDHNLVKPHPFDGFTVGKRGLGSEFLGKPKHDNSFDYSFKRGRLGSEFLGKRSGALEQPQPYLQATSRLSTVTETESNSTEEH